MEKFTGNLWEILISLRSNDLKVYVVPQALYKKTKMSVNLPRIYP